MLKNFGRLQAHYIPASSSHSKTAVIMLHGYGANAFDLAPLQSLPGPLSQDHWYFVQAPLPLPMGPYEGRAWFPIDMEERQMQAMRGERFDFSEQIPPTLSAVSTQLQELVDLVAPSYKKIILGGFSQGGMMALDLAFHTKQNIEGLILLSTNPLAKSRWQQALSEKKPESFRPWLFQSHGKQDPMLPYSNARELFDWLRPHVPAGRFVSFQGGHEIPQKVWNELGAFINETNTNNEATN